ncbi:hypothetical protein Godav_017713, partial [Gossypium davidsonii]|nr:hypothetical protein [Gossypium davidsonii]MBA0639995.1 hypothetical protein [Gossypium klotzschianum]
VKRHKVGVHNQVVASTQQQATPNQQESTPTQQAVPTHHKDATLREKLSFKRKPTTVRWMLPT